MAGIYIHIPFCRKKCHYCDFYRSVNLLNKNNLVESILKETELKKDFLKHQTVSTIYFGGGTPSVLGVDEINKIIFAIESTHTIDDDAEITFETNPDDLTVEYITTLKKYTVVNRLSIGIQSFDNDDLKRMNRRHDSKKAVDSIQLSLKYGFNNISIDLIYGLPGMTAEKWEKNLLTAFSFDIKHLSAYHLTYEPETIFHKKLQKGIFKKATEEESIRQFELLVEIAGLNNFIHYEISNFAPDGFFSRHNSNYWLQKMYLGLGPSAHSYNLESRHWNIADNLNYIQKIKDNENFFTSETLDTQTRYNEYVMTRLRTIWGVELSSIQNDFGDFYVDFFVREVQPFLCEGHIEKKGSMYRLTTKGMLISDFILSKLIC
jgi:oxygen-independent coproporphyrinogen III oxidase